MTAMPAPGSEWYCTVTLRQLLLRHGLQCCFWGLVPLVEGNCQLPRGPSQCAGSAVMEQQCLGDLPESGLYHAVTVSLVFCMGIGPVQGPGSSTHSGPLSLGHPPMDWSSQVGPK